MFCKSDSKVRCHVHGGRRDAVGGVIAGSRQATRQSVSLRVEKASSCLTIEDLRLKMKTEEYRKKQPEGCFFLGGPEGIRTHDLSDANRTLSQLSYRPKTLQALL